MTKLLWDQSGTRLFETGIDRGVLYLEDFSGVSWSGFRSLDEDNSSVKTESLYLDGVKSGETVTEGDYAAKLEAYTYPDQFSAYQGVLEVASGMFVDAQRPKRFSLSYRTLIGNDTEGTSVGYKIHIVYFLTAQPSNGSQDSLSNSANFRDLSWDIDSVPVQVPGYRPTAHYILDSRTLPPRLLSKIEGILYGTDSSESRLPPIDELHEMVMDYWLIEITDNGDGTWTAEGPDDLIQNLGDGEWTISEANVVWLNDESYTISSRYF